MSDYFDENSTQVISTFDPSALSYSSRYHLMQYMDQEGEATIRDLVRIQRAVVVGNRAIAGQVAVSQTAMTAKQMVPHDEEKIERIVEDVNRRLREIVGNRRY